MLALRVSKTIERFFDRLMSLRCNNQGNMGIIAGLSFGVILICIAAAVDIAIMTSSKDKVRTSLDNSALAAAINVSSGLESLSENQKLVTKMVRTNSNGIPFIFVGEPVLSIEDDKAIVEMDVKYKSVFPKIWGEEVASTIRSEATIAASVAEMVLVLDTSFSMKGSRLKSLKEAAKDLVDELVDPKSKNFKLGIVPFGTHVNVGVDKKTAFWTSVNASKNVSWDQCSTSYDEYIDAGCTQVDTTCLTDGIKRRCKRWSCPSGVEPKKTCRKVHRVSDFKGCVSSRPYPYNLNDASFNEQKVNGVLMTNNWHCPSELTELSNNKLELSKKINDIAVRGETYIPAGLVWAYRMLTPSEPFTNTVPFFNDLGEENFKSIVLMSDGANARSPRKNWKGEITDHYSTDTDLANDYTREVCENIKGAGVFIYTIAFEVEDEETIDLLRSCATSDDYAYVAEDSFKLKNTFKTIASEFKTVRLNR